MATPAELELADDILDLDLDSFDSFSDREKVTAMQNAAQDIQLLHQQNPNVDPLEQRMAIRSDIEVVCLNTQYREDVAKCFSQIRDINALGL